jgi:hypothetical protein
MLGNKKFVSCRDGLERFEGLLNILNESGGRVG